MTEGKLIFCNVRKNLQDYMIYFLTLMISVGMFYAFNSVQTQPALNDLDATRQLLSDQLGILLSALSVVVAPTDYEELMVSREQKKRVVLNEENALAFLAAQGYDISQLVKRNDN